MISARFLLPDVGPPETVTLPSITRGSLPNGLRVWTIRAGELPLVAATLLIDATSADDPSDRTGLAAITADLADEGADGRDAIDLADAWARIGGALESDVSADTTAFSFGALSQFLDHGLALLAGIVLRPSLAQTDFVRIRETRDHRLQQLRELPAAAAERVLLRAVFDHHGYGHTPLGTTAGLAALSVDDVRAFWASRWGPRGATLLVAGDIDHGRAMAAAQVHFGGWAAQQVSAERPTAQLPPSPARVWLIDRPGAPQSELRIGHVGVPRDTPDYPAVAALNALLGGQFSSRINQRLRQDKGYTYGARTNFDMRRWGGTFVCETSVQSDATGAAIRDVLAECADVGGRRAPDAAELARTKDGLTRGYVRHFETPGQLVRAAAQLAVYELPDDAFDRFVPSVLALDGAAITAAARAHLHSDALHVVIVGDAGLVGPTVADLGRPVVPTTAEF